MQDWQAMFLGPALPHDSSQRLMRDSGIAAGARSS